MNRVLDKFQTIGSYSGSSAYLVEPVQGLTGAYAGRSSTNRAVFVLVDRISPNRPIQTGALRIDIGVAFEAQINGEGQKLDRALVVELLQSNSELEVYFSEICAALELQMSNLNNQADILSHLRTLAELFGFKQVSREMVKGLWGELKFASLFPNMPDAIGRWHDGSFGRVDFDSKQLGWEIKTVEGAERKHRLNLSQLSRPDDLLVSLCVEESPAGQSLSELIDEVIPLLPEDLQFKVRIRALSYSSSRAFSQLKLSLQRNELRPRAYRVDELCRPEVPESVADYVSTVSFTLLISVATSGFDLLDISGTALSGQALELLLDR